MRAVLFSVLICVATVASGFAQEKSKILLMTGKVIEGEVTELDSAYVYYNYFKRNGSSVPKKLDAERVFSYLDAEGVDHIVYTVDTLIGNYFSEDEMRLYIQGEQDAINYYRGNWTISAGLPITAGLGFVTSGTIFSFGIPFLYLVGTSLPNYRIPRDRVSSPELIGEPAYILGFERAARNKRLFKSLMTGLVGTAIGFTLGQTINQ